MWDCMKRWTNGGKLSEKFSNVDWRRMQNKKCIDMAKNDTVLKYTTKGKLYVLMKGNPISWHTC